MNLHVDPETNIFRARRPRYVPLNTPAMRQRLDEAACRLTVELVRAGAKGGAFYITIGAGELHLFSPREVMKMAQDSELRCDFVVDWHELKSNIAAGPPPASHSPRSEPASAVSPGVDAGSTLSVEEASV